MSRFDPSETFSDDAVGLHEILGFECGRLMRATNGPVSARITYSPALLRSVPARIARHNARKAAPSNPRRRRHTRPGSRPGLVPAARLRAGPQRRRIAGAMVSRARRSGVVPCRRASSWRRTSISAGRVMVVIRSSQRDCRSGRSSQPSHLPESAHEQGLVRNSLA